MHSRQAGEVQNNRVRTFKILEVLQGKMQTHALSKTVKLYLHTVFRQKWYRAKIQVGFYQLYFVPLHSVCSKRLCVVQSAHEEDEGAQKKKPRYVYKRTVHQRIRPTERSVPANAFIHIFYN